MPCAVKIKLNVSLINSDYLTLINTPSRLSGAIEASGKNKSVSVAILESLGWKNRKDQKPMKSAQCPWCKKMISNNDLDEKGKADFNSLSASIKGSRPKVGKRDDMKAGSPLQQKMSASKKERKKTPVGGG